MRHSATFGNLLPPSSSDPVGSSGVFRILVLADLGSDQTWGDPVTVDRDDLDDVMERLNIQLNLADDPLVSDVSLKFAELEDFHPDSLFERLALFDSLRTRRRRLKNDKTFAAEAAAILGSQSATSAIDSPAADAADESASAAAAASGLLDAALEQTKLAQQPVVQQIVEGSLDIDTLARRLVAPYVVQKSDPRKPELMAAVDQAIAETMRALLHHPAYQRLEATWLGIRLLVRRLETDATLTISLLNVSKDQLRADVCADDDLTISKLYSILVDSTSVPGARPWTAVIGDFEFDGGSDDTEVLGRVARIHAAAGAEFMAAASPGIVGCSSAEQLARPKDWSEISAEQTQRWNTLRSLPATASVHLVLPRLLARSPYGRNSAPIEALQFEEVPDGSVHDDYLWMNAAFGVGALQGESFSRVGLSYRSAWDPGLEDLPIHIWQVDGESRVQSSSEADLPPQAAERCAQFGLTLVHSVHGQDSVQIPILRSLHDGGTASAIRDAGNPG